MGRITVPIIPLPKQARAWMVKKAVWDYMRANGLTFDEANSVKEAVEIAVMATLDLEINGVKSLRPSEGKVND